MTPGEAEAIAARLEAHPDYRVLRRLRPDHTTSLSSKFIRHAAIVDTETTGTDPVADKVIELAILKFEYCAESGAIGRVLGRYDAFEDPEMPIPPESTAIHGITDDMVRGQRLDDAAIAVLLEGVGLVVAHNARFDRGFLETRLPSSASVHPLCDPPLVSAGNPPGYRHGPDHMMMPGLSRIRFEYSDPFTYTSGRSASIAATAEGSLTIAT